MMQQINLFVADYAPAKAQMGLRRLLHLIGGLLLLLVIIGAFLSQQLYNERQSTSAARANLEAVIGQIRQTQGNQQAEQNVREQLQTLRTRIADRQLLLDDLEQRERQQTTGFAPLLRVLAEQHDGRLWLTQIGIHHGQLQLAGETLNAAAVAGWLGRLQSSPPIQGQRFAGLSLSRIENKPGVLAFRVTPELLPGELAADAIEMTQTNGANHASAQR